MRPPSTSSTDPPLSTARPKVDVGRITRPHGLRGEVVVDLWTNREERMEPGTTLDTSLGRPLTIVRSRRQARHWLVVFDGVVDREGADALRAVVLSADPIDDPDAVWVADLIGAEVFAVSGERLGTVAAIEANPASDLIVLDGDGLIPLRFVAASTPGRVVVDIPEGLLD